MPSVQTTQRLEERIGRHGAAFDSSVRSHSRIADAAMRPGDVAIRAAEASEGDLEATPLTAPAAADADAIVDAAPTAAGAQELTGAALDGVIGAEPMIPARNLTVDTNSHADWDDTDITIEGEDPEGNVISEVFEVSDGGGDSLTGSLLFRRVTKVSVPAQSGTSGVLDVGTGTDLGELSSRDVAGLVRYLAAREVADVDTAEYAAGETLNIVHRGPVWLEVEEDVADGERVFVRLVTSGAEVLGGFRRSADGSAGAPDAVPIKGWRFRGASIDRDSVKLAIVDIP